MRNQKIIRKKTLISLTSMMIVILFLGLSFNTAVADKDVSAISAVDVDETAELEKKLAEAKARIAELEGELEIAEGKIARLMADLTKAREKIAFLEEQLEYEDELLLDSLELF